MPLKMSPLPPVVHGGDLWRAIQQYGGTPQAWLDLSTGINAHTYPVPPLPDDVWRCLPDDHDDLNEIAARYYGLGDDVPLLAVPGSQYAIRHLPALLPRGVVGIAELSYGEYAPAFERAGHEVIRYRYPSHDASRNAPDTSAVILHPDHALPDALRYLVVVNPNNPTTDQYPVSTLLKWRETLHARGGMLIVDEAFADVAPAGSVLPALAAGRTSTSPTERAHHAGAVGQAFAGLIVLRSVGKFFGLAGIRAGFAIGAAPVLQALKQHMGAWAVSGPARHAMRHAFADLAWQSTMRTRLKAQSAAMVEMLAAHRLHGRATPLFIWLAHAEAAELQKGLAQHHIWTRLFGACTASDGKASLRLGIPAEATDLDRLDKALAKVLR